MSKATDRRRFLTASTSSVLGLAASSLLRPHVASAESGRIRVGQIGTAHAHAAGKMATLRELPHVFDVVGIVEPDADQRERAAKDKSYAGLRWMSERELLSAKGLQCVIVETEIKDLVPTGQRCVDAGMHIHLDKPAGESLTELRRLHETAVAADRCIQMGYMFRYNPAFQLAERAAREGWLGTVFELHAVMSKKVSQAARDQLRQYRGGTMFELGCHLIDAMVWILGRPDKTIATVRRTGDDGLADNMLATFEYPQASATIRSSVIEPFGFRRRQFTIVGTEGVADIRPLEPPVIELSLEQARGEFKQGTQTPTLAPRSGRYDGDLLDLAAVIRGEKQLQWDAEHDLATHETILRASGLQMEP